MSQPILVGYDPRRRDRAPVQFGVLMARLTGAPLIVASVEARVPVLPIDPGGEQPYGIGQVDEDLPGDCTDAIEEVEIELSALGIDVDCRKLRSTSAARALQEEAKAEDASLLVVGSPARRLLHGSPCPVAVVPRGWRADGKPRTVGVAYVDTDEGRAALLAAHALARRAGATLRAISVVKATMEMHLETETYVAGQFGRDLEDVEGEHRLWAERRLHEAVEELNDGVPVEVEAVVGDPAETLIATSEHLDLLVCGSRGYGPVRGVLLGSVSRRVTAEARCPVIVLRRGAAAGSAPVAFLAEHELLGQGRASRR